jgi:hypothetical protein
MDAHAGGGLIAKGTATNRRAVEAKRRGRRRAARPNQSELKGASGAQLRWQSDDGRRRQLAMDANGSHSDPLSALESQVELSEMRRSLIAALLDGIRSRNPGSVVTVKVSDPPRL